MVNALLISAEDNVVTVIKEVKTGEKVVFDDGGKITEIVTSGVPAYHKIARREIRKDENVIKYGQIMAVATQDIKMGEHIHTHNITSKVQ